jgi:hypothetical protein
MVSPAQTLLFDLRDVSLPQKEVITHEFEKPPKGFPNPPALC